MFQQSYKTIFDLQRGNRNNYFFRFRMIVIGKKAVPLGQQNLFQISFPKILSKIKHGTFI